LEPNGIDAIPHKMDLVIELRTVDLQPAGGCEDDITLPQQLLLLASQAASRASPPKSRVAIHAVVHHQAFIKLTDKRTIRRERCPQDGPTDSQLPQAAAQEGKEQPVVEPAKVWDIEPLWQKWR
jgi:hypothetical protein